MSDQFDVAEMFPATAARRRPMLRLTLPTEQIRRATTALVAGLPGGAAVWLLLPNGFPTTSVGQRAAAALLVAALTGFVAVVRGPGAAAGIGLLLVAVATGPATLGAWAPVVVGGFAVVVLAVRARRRDGER